MIPSYLAQTRESIEKLASDTACHAQIEEIGNALCGALAAGNKLLLAGNGGSAADCQHMAGELAGRFRKDRRALAAMALTVDTSVLTACLNDFGPNTVFARQVEALGKPGDILWAISTSGNSGNIIEACHAARRVGMKILGFTGGTGGAMADLCDWMFVAPSAVTSHIQECHITVGHLLCLYIEENLCKP